MSSHEKSGHQAKSIPLRSTFSPSQPGKLSVQRRLANPIESPGSSEGFHPGEQPALNPEAQFGHSFSRIAVQPTSSPAIQTKLAAQPGDNQQVSAAENRAGMPYQLKAGLEALSGMDLSSVRVHHNSSRPAQVNALAYTQGQDIYLGQGQERHLPHEGWHVVQQMQGRVNPTIQAKGVSINNDAGLEREADVMGAKALQMKVAELATTHSSQYRSSALQMRSSLRAVSSNSVIQRYVDTWGGRWDTDQYDLRKDSVNGRNYPPNLGVRGVDIKLKFTPGSNVNAELIGLTQSVQSFVNGAASYTNPTNQAMSVKSADAININTGVGETDEGTAIDRLDSRVSPIYGTQNTRSSGGDVGDLSSYDAGGNNQYGYRYTDATGLKQKDAWLFDAPTRSNAEKNSRHIFETTALAIKGVQAGTYYGSVRWGWRTDDKGNFSKIPLTKVSDGVPSSTFMKSAEIWNASKSSTGADTVDLPIVDVKVTTAPVTLMPPIPMQDITLPVGTRVQIIQDWHPPLLYGTVKVIDGPHTGITGEVNYQEWGNIVDERP